MIQLTAALKKVEATTKPGEKMAAIRGLDSDNQKLLHLAQNPFITFGVKKIPDYTCRAGHKAAYEDLKLFFGLADRLAGRELTGHLALEAIAQVLSTYTLETAQTLEKILKKDLRANLGTTLINKVYKKLVPEFDCMLADKMDKRFNWDAGPWLVEYKYDGMRIIARVEKDTVTYFSRSGIEQPKFVGVFDDELLELRALASEDLYFDGEVMAPTFQETMNARASDGDTSNLVYKIFDMLYATEWVTQTCGVGNLSRRNRIQDLYELRYVRDGRTGPDPLRNYKGRKVQLSEGLVLHTKTTVETFYSGLVAQGAEGVIIKNPTAPYKWKRDRAWIKYKPIYTADLKLLGMYEGTGKYKGSLGGFQLEGKIEDGTKVRADCGSGFNDDQRKEFWANQKAYLGKTIEVEYQEVSKAQKKEIPSLRFPVFKTVRVDK